MLNALPTRRRPSITFWRRLTQGAMFALIVYGAFFFKPESIGHSTLPPVPPPPGEPATSRFQPGQILWASDDKPVLDSYPPGAACRYNPKGGFVKACVVHFLSENLTWGTAFKYLLPHLLFFTLLAFLVGRWWCGWVCPLGTLGDALTWLRVKLNMPHLGTPPRLRDGLRWGSYGLLAVSLFVSWLISLPRFAGFKCSLFLPYCQVCPGRLICPTVGGMAPSWRDFSTTLAGIFTVAAWLVLGVFLLAFFLGRRIWCHVCPIGLMTSWFNRGGGMTLEKVEAAHCNRCSACADACPMALTHVRDAREPKTLNTPQCIHCLRCVDVCPRDNCLKAKVFGLTVATSSFAPRVKRTAGDINGKPQMGTDEHR